MVEVSNLRNLSIYTNTGYYVGRVEDVVLNIRLGTISKLQVRAIEPERKSVGFMDTIRETFQGGVDEDVNARSFQNDLLTVDFDKVQAIGDIMLINPKDIKKVNPESNITDTVSPKPVPKQVPSERVQSQFENNTTFEPEKL